MNGKKVRCAKCNNVMVAAADEPAVLEAVEVVDEPVVPIANKARAVRADHDAASESQPTVEPIRDEEGDVLEEQPSRDRNRKKKPSKRSQNPDGVTAVAFYQRAVLLCILGNLIAGILRVFLPPDIGLLFWFALIPVGIASALFAILLARELLGTVAGVFLGVLTIIPGLGLIILLIINQRATRRLKDNGIRVGLLGANVPWGSPSPIKWLTLPVVAGALTLFFAVAMAGGYFLIVDRSGPWPELPPVRGGRTPTRPEDELVHFHIAGVGDDYTYEAIRRELAKFGPGATSPVVRPSMDVYSKREGDRMTATVRDVKDARAVAKLIEFGKVRRVWDHTVTIDAKKLEGLPAPGDEVAKALFELKSGEDFKEREALNRLKNIKPDERRDQVVAELKRQFMLQRPFSHNEAAEALVAWADKEDSVTFFVTASKTGDLNLRLRVIPLLAATKDERAIEPLATLMEEFAGTAHAAVALKTFGPKAEPAVAKRLANKERFVVVSACEVLKEIGTPASIADLEKIAQNRRDRALALQAGNAIKAIKARQ
jgi:hypothetical protein